MKTVTTLPPVLRFILFPTLAGSLLFASPARIESVTKTGEGVEVKWDKGGADTIDLLRGDGKGGWQAVLLSTPSDSIVLPDASVDDKFRLGNPLSWRFRTLRESRFFYPLNSLAIDAKGNPAILFYEREEEDGMLRLARNDGKDWSFEDVLACAFPGCVKLHFLPDGRPFIAYTSRDGVLHLMEQEKDGGWSTNAVAKKCWRFSMAAAPEGPLFFTFDTHDPEANMTKSALGEWKGGIWKQAFLEGLPNGVEPQVAVKSDGLPVVAFSVITSRTLASEVRYREFDGKEWKESLVSKNASLPELVIAGDERTYVSFNNMSKSYGKGIARLADGAWETTIFDNIRTGYLSALAATKSGRLGMVYSDTTGANAKARYASHDLQEWHKSTFLTSGGEGGFSLQFTPDDRPVFCFSDINGGGLRVASLEPHETGAQRDDRKTIKAPSLEMAVLGEKLELRKEHIEGLWMRTDPEDKNSRQEIHLGKDGKYVYRIRGGPFETFSGVDVGYDGTYTFAKGIISAKLDKGNNPLVFEDGEVIELEVKQVTVSHLEVSSPPGAPARVYMKQ